MQKILPAPQVDIAYIPISNGQVLEITGSPPVPRFCPNFSLYQSKTSHTSFCYAWVLDFFWPQCSGLCAICGVLCNRSLGIWEYGLGSLVPGGLGCMWGTQLPLSPQCLYVAHSWIWCWEEFLGLLIPEKAQRQSLLGIKLEHLISGCVPVGLPMGESGRGCKSHLNVGGQLANLN